MATKSTTTVETAAPSTIDETVLVEESTTHNTTTAYKFAKRVNELLKERAPELKELPAQMFYSYKTKGLIGTPAKPLTLEFAETWVDTYIARKLERNAAAATKVASELSGDHNIPSSDPINEPDASTN